MRPTIERRVEVLESAAAQADDIMLILHQIVTPGRPTGEAVTAEALGQKFRREPSETEAEFIERIRVYALAHRAPGQFGVQVIFDDEDVDL